MSRLKERKEKNCLNCSTKVQGKYCQHCGQENIEPKETFWHLISHFFKDITHFDGNFFSTMRYLIAKPGYLSKEYMLGRRAKYVNPIRMYIFSSAFFFLIFFSIYRVDEKSFSMVNEMNGKSYAQIEMMDSIAFDAFTKNVNKEDGKASLPMSREVFKKYFDSSIQSNGINFTSSHYETKEAYDSLLQAGSLKHGWLKRQLIYKEIEINRKYHNNQKEVLGAFTYIFLHSLPQMVFILLPIFALLLKLLYIRRKDYYYVNHGIFSLHYYIFLFIGMLILFGLGKLNGLLHWKLLDWLVIAGGIGLFFYLYKAMRNFYQQRRAKTVFKFLLLCFFVMITIGLLFAVFFFFSLFKL